MEEKREKSVFRKQSLQRISSPEKTDDYVHIPNPELWPLAGAFVLLAAGVAIYASALFL